MSGLGDTAGPRLGVIGGGQLGRMLGLAAVPLGIGCRFLEASPTPPAAAVGEVVAAAPDDAEALDRFADGLDAATYESESIPAFAVERIATRCPMLPSVRSLRVAQDRLVEKRFLAAHGLATAPFAAVDDREGLDAAVAEIGLPALLKTRRFGYDGRGQVAIDDAGTLDAAWGRLGGRDRGLILERRLSFRRELATLGVRGADGATAVYPVVETRHREGILRVALAPAPDLAADTASWLCRQTVFLLDALGHVGVLAVEWFDTGGELVANEIAPRVHNSGHWTIEAAVTSQFENHVRAVCGLPLGDPRAREGAVMVNLIGAEPPRAALLAAPGVHLHLYGKAPRPGRKLGHLTALRGEADASLEAVAERLVALGGQSAS